MNVSVVVPVFNGARDVEALATALENLQPVGAGLEVVVVDDGSIDDTAVRLASHPVRVLRQPRRGPAAARNTGWRATMGEVVLFTDADCRPPPDWVVQLVGGFDSPEVGAVAGSYSAANPEVSLAAWIQAEIRRRHLRMPRYVRSAGSFNLAVRRCALDGVGGFDERYPRASGEDTDLSYRLLAAGWRIRFLPDCQVAHRHPERLGPYLRTQARHGFWRGRLYRRHPRYLTGDDYTGWGDAIGAGLALLAPLGLLAGAIWPPALGVAGVILAALLLLSAGQAAGVARTAGRAGLAPLGVGVLTLRAFARAAGWAAGVVYNVVDSLRSRVRL